LPNAPAVIGDASGHGSVSMGTGGGRIAASSSKCNKSRSRSRRGPGEGHCQAPAPPGGSVWTRGREAAGLFPSGATAGWTPQPKLRERHVPKDAVPERHCVRERGVHHEQQRPRAHPSGARHVGCQLSGGHPVRSVVSRLARLERLNRMSTAPSRLRVQYGYMKTLPDDYTGPRHTVTVSRLQMPPAPTTGSSSTSATSRKRMPESAHSPARHRYRYG